MSEFIPEFQIAKMRLAPGDVLVIRLDRPVPGEIVARFRDETMQRLPAGVKLLIIDRSIDLSILTKADVAIEVFPPCDTERG